MFKIFYRNDIVISIFAISAPVLFGYFGRIFYNLNIMKLLNHIINKTISLSLSTLATFIIIANVTSCDGCGNEQKDLSGTLALTADKVTLKGKSNCEFKLTLQGAEANKEAIISNFKLRVTIQREGGVAGESDINYTYSDQAATIQNIVIKDNLTPVTKEIGDFFTLDDKIKLSDNDILETICTFNPGTGVSKLVATFELLNQNDISVGIPCSVTWEADVPTTYQIILEGLEKNDSIPASNKFTLKIKKDIASIGVDEVKDLQIVADIRGDAIIQGGKTISFVNTDVKAGIIEKKVIVNPGTLVTEISLQLEHNGKNIAVSKPIKVKAKVPTAKTYTVKVDKKHIDDGSTDLMITLIGSEELDESDLNTSKFKFNRIQGNQAKIGSTPNENTAFNSFSKLDINPTNKKEARKNLTIFPGNDRSAKFDLILLDKDQKVLDSQLIEWSDGIDLDIITLEYNPAQSPKNPSNTPQIKYEIKNSTRSTITDFNLCWKSTSGATIRIGTPPKNKGDINISLNNINQMASGELPVDWGTTDKYGTFVFTVRRNTVIYATSQISLAKTTPEATIDLVNPAETRFIGADNKKVQFVITAGPKDLLKEDLEFITLNYSTTGNEKLMHGTKDAKDQTLCQLLGINSLVKNTSANVELTIDNANNPVATFTDIMLKGTNLANKVKNIEWISVDTDTHIEISTKQLVVLNKRVGINIINHSGRTLDKDDLEKITFNYEADQGMLRLYQRDAKDKNLYELLENTPLKKDESTNISLNINVAEGVSSATFKNIRLAGNLNTNKIESITWKDINLETKLATKTELVGADKTVIITITNHSGHKLAKEELERIRFEYTYEVSVSDNKDRNNNQEKDRNKNEDKNKGTNSSEIDEYLNNMLNQPNNMDHLNPPDEAYDFLNANTLTPPKLIFNQEDANDKSLWELLNNEEIDNNASKNVTLFIDCSEDAPFSLVGLRLDRNTNDKGIPRITWKPGT